MPASPSTPVLALSRRRRSPGARSRSNRGTEPLFRDWLFTTDYRRFLESNLTLAGIAQDYR